MLFTSQTPKSFPIPKPVINTSLPTGVPCVSEHGRTGLTVPPKNAAALAAAIQKLADHPELRKIYGKAAVEKVRQEYDITQIIDKIYNVLKEGTG